MMSNTSNVVVAPIATTTTTTGYPATAATTTGYPATATTTTTGYPVATGAAPIGYPATTATTATTDKKLIKEQEKVEKQHEKEVVKEQKELSKEEKKREKLALKEQKKREKEEKKMLKTREKEEKKQRKLMQKEEEKRIHEQRALHETAQKARMEKYRAEEKATTARLMSDVKEFDLAHAHTAPLGLYSEQVDDALPYVPENVGLFIAIARGMNLIDAKEAKADAYVRVLVLGAGPDGKEVVHASHKSEVKSNTANPEWWFHADDTPHLVTENVGWLRTGKLRIEVWDHDKSSEDELLGVIEWSLSALDGKVTRGNFALQASQLPLATGRTTRKSTKPGTIFAEIRYRSPFAFLGMNQQQQQQQQQQQPGMMMQQQQQPMVGGMMQASGGLPLASTSTTTTTTTMSSGPVVASGGVAAATHHQHHTGPGMHHGAHHTTGLQHHGAGMHTGALAGTGLHGTALPATTTTTTTTGLSTVYKAPDVIVPAGAMGSMGAVAPGAISHTHHIHATELPVVAATSTSGLAVMGASQQPHLLGGEQKKEYMLSEQQKSGMMSTTGHQPLPIVTGTSAMGASLPPTPAEPHNTTHNLGKTGAYPTGTSQPLATGAVGTTGVTGATALPGYHPASDPALNPVLTGAKPMEYQTAAPALAGGVQQPMVGATGGAPVVGAINLADPPRHVM